MFTVFMILQSELYPDRDHGGRVFRNQAILSSLEIPQVCCVNLCSNNREHVFRNVYYEGRGVAWCRCVSFLENTPQLCDCNYSRFFPLISLPLTVRCGSCPLPIKSLVRNLQRVPPAIQPQGRAICSIFLGALHS